MRSSLQFCRAANPLHVYRIPKVHSKEELRWRGCPAWYNEGQSAILERGEWVNMWGLNTETSMLSNQQWGFYLSEKRLIIIFWKTWAAKQKSLADTDMEGSNKTVPSPIQLSYSETHQSIICLHAQRIPFNDNVSFLNQWSTTRYVSITSNMYNRDIIKIKKKHSKRNLESKTKKFEK